MKLISYFSNNFVPATGLTPTIDAWESDGTQIITAATMTESDGGFYYYEFSGYDDTKDYGFRADGGATLPSNERYVTASNDLNQVTTATTSITSDIASVQGDVTQLGTDLNAVSELVKELRFGNQRIDFTFASAANTTRNVKVGMLDYQTIYLKSDSATDWSSPISTKILYFWYDTSKILIAVKENDV